MFLAVALKMYGVHDALSRSRESGAIPFSLICLALRSHLPSPLPLEAVACLPVDRVWPVTLVLTPPAAPGALCPCSRLGRDVPCGGITAFRAASGATGPGALLLTGAPSAGAGSPSRGPCGPSLQPLPSLVTAARETGLGFAEERSWVFCFPFSSCWFFFFFFFLRGGGGEGVGGERRGRSLFCVRKTLNRVQAFVSLHERIL